MTETVTERPKEVSQFDREFSQKVEERSSMSSAEDVLEMEGLANKLATKLVGEGADPHPFIQ